MSDEQYLGLVTLGEAILYALQDLKGVNDPLKVDRVINQVDPLYSVQQAAEFCGVSAQTIRNWEKKGYIKRQNKAGVMGFKLSALAKIRAKI